MNQNDFNHHLLKESLLGKIMKFCISYPLEQQQNSHYSKITYNGQDYHNKIKDVPGNFEVVPPQPNEFEYTFCSENCYKDEVEDHKYIFQLHRHVVVLEHHGQHVQNNNDHDYNVKFLIYCDVKDERCQFVLK